MRSGASYSFKEDDKGIVWRDKGLLSSSAHCVGWNGGLGIGGRTWALRPKHWLLARPNSSLLKERQRAPCILLRCLAPRPLRTNPPCLTLPASHSSPSSHEPSTAAPKNADCSPYTLYLLYPQFTPLRQSKHLPQSCSRQITIVLLLDRYILFSALCCVHYSFHC